MKLLFTLLFFIIFTVSLAHSTSQVPTDFVASSFSANFEESIYKASMGKESKSYGKIDYKYPGHIRYETTSDPQKTFVANPTKSWFYVPPFIPTEQGEVTIQKSNQLPITKILDAMKKGLSGSKMFTPAYAAKDLILTFSPEIQKETSIKAVTLHATTDAEAVKSLKEFESLEIEYVDKRKVKMKFLEMKENVAFGASHFIFSIPEKTRVTTN